MAIQLAWSIGLNDDDAAARAFDALVELARELLAHHFPPSCGYQAYGVRLCGPIEGVQWQVGRGRFIGDLGLQKSLLAHAGTSPKKVELRLVASSPERAASPSVDDGLQRWSQLLPQLRAQREIIQDNARPFPFRAPGHVEVRMRHVLAAGSSFTWPRAAALASEAIDQPAAPPGRTAHTPPRSQDSGT